MHGMPAVFLERREQEEAMSKAVRVGHSPSAESKEMSIAFAWSYP